MAVNTHIINVAFDFDDDAIKKRLEDTAEKTIIDGIKHDLIQMLHKKMNSWNSHGFGESMSDKEKYAEVMEKYMRDAVETVIETHKDAIIDLAADKLVDKIYRTKKFKEKIDATINNSVKS